MQFEQARETQLALAETDYDPNDREAAKEKVLDVDKEYMGVLYRDENSRSYERTHGLDTDMSDIDESGAPEGAMDLVREFY